jgi:murein DD-endopeptidase MepM/ murein hydrolase activator NlpD
MPVDIDSELSRLSPDLLDAHTSFEWRQLTRQVLRSRRRPHCANVNVTLRAAAEREPQSPLAPAYRLWMADNHARDGSIAEAFEGYDACVLSAAAAPRLVGDCDIAFLALHAKAQAAALAGQAELAISTYRDAARLKPADGMGLLHAGMIAERSGRVDVAAELYRSVSTAGAPHRCDDPNELARRALLRLNTPGAGFAADAQDVGAMLTTALERRDAVQLRTAASATHFAIGPTGGHTSFDTDGLLDHLYDDLSRSRVRARAQLLGSGDKRYLHTSGWRGRWYRGDVLFIITRAPRGWQWTGLGISAPNELWLEKWRPPTLETNQPLPFELLAPWPAGQSFKAGGLKEFLIQQAAVLVSPFGALIALNFSRNRCGFGPRGFYYNQWPTHEGNDAFAIDFTRYRRYVPYDNESGGTPVLAVRSGIVVDWRAGIPSGDPSFPNFVDIVHPDPADPSKPTRFHTRYLHLDGPYKINVSPMMPVVVGTRLGLMDDTGTSVLNHLHFSIHDRDIPRPGAAYGASVRPTPLSGVRLEDGDDGVCVRSNNIEFVEKPMIEVTTFAGQNWVITPAALAANEAPPTAIKDQKFLMVLSGVAMLDLKGSSTSQWRRETVVIFPDVQTPMLYAINRYGIPTPPGATGLNYWTALQLDQWAPFAALSSIYNKDESNNSGFAVDVWRPNPFNSGRDAFTNAPLTNLFTGIQVDVAVRDTDAWLHRLSYHITLIGRIVFGPIIIT